MSSHTSHLGTTPVVRNVRSLANRQNRQKRGQWGSSQLPPAKRHISVPAGERDSSQGGSSVASTIKGQNSIASSSLSNSSVAAQTQLMTSTLCTTQRRSSNAPATTSDTSSCSTPVPAETPQTDSTRRVVSSPVSGIASTPTPLRGLETLPTPFPNPEARAIITNPLWTQATQRNQRQREWQLQLQPQGVSTPRSMVFGSHSVHWFGHSDIMRLVFATGRLLELYRWNRWLFMSASDLETVSDAIQRIAKAFAEAPHWQVIEMYWNTAMQ